MAAIANGEIDAAMDDVEAHVDEAGLKAMVEAVKDSDKSLEAKFTRL